MAFVTRHRIEDQLGRVWTGADFSRDEDCAEEYRDLDEAEAEAVQLGGLVETYQRFAEHDDLPRAPFLFLEAAE
jgi:hypothetical protein